MSNDEFQAPVHEDPLFQAEVDRIMDDGELPAQLNELHRAWPETTERVLLLKTAVELRVHLRGVPICVHVPYSTWPAEPPVLTVTDMPRIHPNILPSGRVAGLDGQKDWNRTVTLADLLHEVECRFIERPPRPGGHVQAALQRLWRRWKGFAPE